MRKLSPFFSPNVKTEPAPFGMYLTLKEIKRGERRKKNDNYVDNDVDDCEHMV